VFQYETIQSPAGFVMRLPLAAILIFMAAASAHAQMTAPPAKAAKPKRLATTPAAPPPLQTPTDTANAMAQAERLALQSDLAWVGDYNGAITGEVSERLVAAIKDYQRSRGSRPSGVLNPQERAVLAETARRRQDNAGWKIITDPGTGVRIGIPTRLVPHETSDGNGAKWSSPTGTIQVLLTRRKEANPTTAKLAEREKKEPPGRQVDYTVVKPDFFVLSGLQGLKKFYLRGTFKGEEVRILTILYDQAVENTVEPVVIAMSSAFNAFPTAAQAGPPPRKIVDYGTGIVVSDDGAILADRDITDGCLAITIPGLGHADLVADDADDGLALLHIYGARGLKPLNLDGGVAKAALELAGIADPQAQGGGAAVSSIKVAVSQVNGGGNLALSPQPPAGFSGAAALDETGRFAGIALLKQVVIATAGPTAAAPTAQAVLVRSDPVHEFLKQHAVTASGASMDAKAAVVRVICVRK
jgi:Putative peptidoglycan binding domain